MRGASNVLVTFAAWNVFFFTAAMLFINVHHYFIEDVLRRFNDPECARICSGRAPPNPPKCVCYS